MDRRKLVFSGMALFVLGFAAYYFLISEMLGVTDGTSKFIQSVIFGGALEAIYIFVGIWRENKGGL